MALPLIARLGVFIAKNIGGKDSESVPVPKVSVEVDSRSLELLLNRKANDIVSDIERSLLKTAQYGTQIILDRTERGIGYKGQFEKYSPGYAKYRAQKGRGQTPDLNFSGRMLSSIQQRKAGRNVAEIYFGRATEAKKAAFNNQKRPFFGFNSSEKDKLQKFFSRDFK